jgi:hypothetical protein
MHSQNLPALYQSADASSNDAQSAYLWLIRLQYSLLISAAVVAMALNQSSELLYIGYALLVAISSVLLIYMSVRKPEKDWYGCRALAESVKTASWRYVMRAEPFESVASINAAREKFSHFLQEILDANSHVRESIARKPISAPQITGEMDRVRSLSVAERLEIYRKKRITDQREWYINKAKKNQSAFKRWIGVCILVQFLAVLSAFLRIYYYSEIEIWPTYALLVLASALIGWIQIKKFNELSSAYNLTAHEIGIVETRVGKVKSEGELSDFVNESERAFSREHTQWIARQNN